MVIISDEHFIWVHDAIGVEYALNLTHYADHICRFGIVEVFGFLKSDSMLSTYTALMIPNESHYKGVDQIVDSVLKVDIVIPWNTAVKMEVAITNMPISCSHNRVFLFSAEGRCLLDNVPRRFNTLVVVLGLQADVVL